MLEESMERKRDKSEEIEKITMELPVKPDYVMVVRLTTAAIMTRAGFNVDDTEDLKMAIAEAYTSIIRLYGQGEGHCCVIEYQFKKGWAKISIGLKDGIPMARSDGRVVDQGREVTQKDELSSFIIHSIMDDVHISRQNGAVVGMTMVKGSRDMGYETE
jgi:serine/threonine-protein kinase RsbW